MLIVVIAMKLLRTKKKVCSRSRPKSYYELTKGGHRMIRIIYARRWRRDTALRWNRRIDEMREADRMGRKAAEDSGWRVRFEQSLARHEARLAEENVVEEGWHSFAYVEDGPTPDWVKSLGDEDPDPDSMVA